MSIPEVTDCIRITCPTFFQRGACPITPMVSPWKKLSFVSQKHVKKLSPLCTVTNYKQSFVQRCSVKKSVLRNFTKLTGKYLCPSLSFNKVAGLRPATLLKKRLWQWYFPGNFAKFLRTLFFTEYLQWLLLTNGIVFLCI